MAKHRLRRPALRRKPCAVSVSQLGQALECGLQPITRMSRSASVAASSLAVPEVRYGGSGMGPDPAISRVLVVDDNAENRALAKATLEDEDIPVVLAANGEDAIA